MKISWREHTENIAIQHVASMKPRDSRNLEPQPFVRLNQAIVIEGVWVEDCLVREFACM